MTKEQIDSMSPDEKIVAIAELCGWSGVPVEQQWRINDGVKYWRSRTPLPVMDALKSDHFSSSMVKRWLRTPQGLPVVQKTGGITINNVNVPGKCVVTEGFIENRNGWEFQTSPWPEVEPSLEAFVKHLPDYLNSLDACAEMEEALDDSQKWSAYRCHLDEVAGEDVAISATASQRATAFLMTMLP
jgi:hypothetical protein